MDLFNFDPNAMLSFLLTFMRVSAVLFILPVFEADGLPPQWKADQETYAHRLALCKACGHLVNGMCELCGCFVEVRAAKINQHCAETAQRW